MEKDTDGIEIRGGMDHTVWYPRVAAFWNDITVGAFFEWMSFDFGLLNSTLLNGLKYWLYITQLS